MSKPKESHTKEALATFMEAHPGVAAILLGILVCACLCLLVWFIAFSGLSSSADFIYSHF